MPRANLVGMVLGPQIVGALCNALIPWIDADSLRFAMIGMSIVAVSCGFHFWIASRMISFDFGGTL